MTDTRPLPAWFDDAKLGIFVRWVASAIPAYGSDREPDLTRLEEFFADNPYAEWY